MSNQNHPSAVFWQERDAQIAEYVKWVSQFVLRGSQQTTHVTARHVRAAIKPKTAIARVLGTI